MPINLEAALTGLSKDPFAAHEVLFAHREESAPFHKEMIELYWSQDPRTVFMCFRQSAKSTRAEESIILQALFRRFNYAVILGANEERACDRLLAIKHQLQTNSALETLFGPSRGELWQATRIVLQNGVCIDAIGAGQSLRGMKYLADRPQYAFIDDLEEQTRYLDNVSTPEKRAELARWFYGSFLPSLAEPGAQVKMAGTPLHEESLVSTLARSPEWKSLVVPIEYLTETGERRASWPSKFPVEKIDRIKAEYEEANQHEVYQQEYLCRAAAPEARSFRAEMFRFEDRERSFEPVYVIYDPARTVGPNSCATGKIAASWLGGRLLVWEASANFWQPDQIIDDIFAADDKYTPIAIGVEITGLHQFIEQPLRMHQGVRGHSIPLRSLNPPRGPGKENFILRLQPLFANGEVIFCGPPARFDALVKELLGFPYGHNDVVNALAYMLEVKPGVAIYENFSRENVFEAEEIGRGENYLLVNSDGRSTCSILVQVWRGALTVLADWVEAADPGACLEELVLGARAVSAGKFMGYAGPAHFQTYDTIGLRAAANACGLRLMRGGDVLAGREELRRLVTLVRGQTPLLRVSRSASWTVRALSGGYAREPGKVETMPGAYRVIGEALESFAAVLAAGLDEGEELTYATDKHGRRYLSAAGGEKKRERT